MYFPKPNLQLPKTASSRKFDTTAGKHTTDHVFLSTRDKKNRAHRLQKSDSELDQAFDMCHSWEQGKENLQEMKVLENREDAHRVEINRKTNWSTSRGLQRARKKKIKEGNIQ